MSFHHQLFCVFLPHGIIILFTLKILIISNYNLFKKLDRGQRYVTKEILKICVFFFKYLLHNIKNNSNTLSLFYTSLFFYK